MNPPAQAVAPLYPMPPHCPHCATTPPVDGAVVVDVGTFVDVVGTFVDVVGIVVNVVGIVVDPPPEEPLGQVKTGGPGIVYLPLEG